MLQTQLIDLRTETVQDYWTTMGLDLHIVLKELAAAIQ